MQLNIASSFLSIGRIDTFCNCGYYRMLSEHPTSIGAKLKCTLCITFYNKSRILAKVIKHSNVGHNDSKILPLVGSESINIGIFENETNCCRMLRECPLIPPNYALGNVIW